MGIFLREGTSHLVRWVVGQPFSFLVLPLSSSGQECLSLYIHFFSVQAFFFPEASKYICKILLHVEQTVDIYNEMLQWHCKIMCFVHARLEHWVRLEINIELSGLELQKDTFHCRQHFFYCQSFTKSEWQRNLSWQRNYDPPNGLVAFCLDLLVMALAFQVTRL